MTFLLADAIHALGMIAIAAVMLGGVFGWCMFNDWRANFAEKRFNEGYELGVKHSTQEAFGDGGVA